MAETIAQTVTKVAPPQGVRGGIILEADANGQFTLPGVAQADIQKIDVADVDLLVHTSDGRDFVLPFAGISAMTEHPAKVVFTDGIITADRLLFQVGSVINLPIEISVPSTLNIQAMAQKIEEMEKQVAEFEEQEKQEEQEEEQEKRDPAPDAVSAVQVNTEASVEQMVEKAQQIVQDLHKSDYDFVPPQDFRPPPSFAAPPGVPAPLSLTPVVNLFMGNVVGATSDSTSMPGVTIVYGAGGADGTAAASLIGPRNIRQFSTAEINGTAGNDLIYAQGPAVGNADPSVSTAMYAKDFMLNVAGYFVTLDDAVVEGVPAGVSIRGGVDQGGGTWTIPADLVLERQSFQLIYDATAPESAGTFDLHVTVTGTTTRNQTFTAEQNFRFMFLDVTSASQVSDSTLVYEYQGLTRDIYVLPTQDQPNLITAGDGNDTIYGGRNNDTIAAGTGNNEVYARDGNDVITTGDGDNLVDGGAGTNSITTGAGNDTISAADGANSIIAGEGTNSVTLGNGNNTVSTGAGNDTIIAGNGDNTITDLAGNNVVTLGDGNNSFTTGDGDNTIETGNGDNSIAVGTGINVIDTGTGVDTVTAGDGTNTITDAGGATVIITGDATNTITLGLGQATITTGSGDDAITVTGGGGSFNLGDGTNSVQGGNGDYILTSGTGDDTITFGAGMHTISMGGGNNTLILGDGAATVTAGSGDDQITVGSGGGSVDAGDGTNNILVGDGDYTISGGSGDDVMVSGTGNSIFRPGLGTNSITAGAGINTIDYSTVAGTGLVIEVGAGTATGTGVNDTFSGIRHVIGSNNGDAITGDASANQLTGGTGNDSIVGGGGSDTIDGGDGDDTLIGGSDADRIYGGDGNNTISGGGGADSLYGGSGNNTFINPTVGTYYDGTNGQNMQAGQLNTIDYSGETVALTINLQGGFGQGGAAQGAVYAFTPTGGVNSINRIIGGTGNDSLLGSAGDDYLDGGAGGSDSLDGGLGNNTLVGGGGTDRFYMGLGNDTIIGSNSVDFLYYQNSDAGVVINFDEVSRSFTNSLGQTLTVDAYSGRGFAATANDQYSYAIGDYYTPVDGTSTSMDTVYGARSHQTLLFSHSTDVRFFGGSAADTVSSGTGNLQVEFSAGQDRYNGGGSGYNVVSSNTAYGGQVNTVVYLDGTKDIDNNGQADHLQRNVASLTSGGEAYDGFMIGWGNATQATAANLTLFKNFGHLLGAGNNDILVGNDNANEINGRGGSNALYGYGGDDTIHAIEGANYIDGGDGRDMLNFVASTNSTIGQLGSWSSSLTAGVSVYLADGSFFAASDKANLWGAGFSTHQVRTGSTGTYLYSQVVNMEDVYGTSYGDVIYGNSVANIIYGNNGNDTIAGGGGADSLYGGSGDDLFLATAAEMGSIYQFHGSTGTDTVQAAGWTFTANSFSDTIMEQIEVLDVRNGAAGESYSMTFRDVQRIHDAGTSSAITLRLDSGDTFTANAGTGTALLVSSSGSEQVYKYYSDPGHTMNDNVNLLATLTIQYA